MKDFFRSPSHGSAGLNWEPQFILLDPQLKINIRNSFRVWTYYYVVLPLSTSYSSTSSSRNFLYHRS